MPYKYTNDTRNMLEGYFNGQTPLERKKPAFGESKNYFIDPNDSTQTIEVPDGTDPYTFRDAGYKAPDTTMSLQPITTSSTTTLSFPFEGQETQENNQLDYSRYGNGFPRAEIDSMLSDQRFLNIINTRVAPNEGGYSNDSMDPGGETNYGISRNQYPNEDIQNMTPERSKALFYRDFWNYNGINTLPDPLASVVLDNAINQGGPQAIRNVHRALGLQPGNIIGSQTHEQLSRQNINDVINRVADEYDQINQQAAERDYRLRSRMRGLNNRSNRYRVY